MQEILDVIFIVDSERLSVTVKLVKLPRGAVEVQAQLLDETKLVWFGASHSHALKQSDGFAEKVAAHSAVLASR